MEYVVETDRLLLREILPTDVDGFLELDSDPRVHKYLGNNPVTDKKRIQEIIAFVRQQYLDNGIGRWAIIEKKSNCFIGWTGLKFVKEIINHHTNYYDLGYRLIHKYWGKGYATESAIASLKFGFEQLNITKIYAAVHHENLASNRILTKLEFEYSGNFFYDDAIHNWYKLDKSKWEISKSNYK